MFITSFCYNSKTLYSLANILIFSCRFTVPILHQIIPFLGRNKDNIQVLEGKPASTLIVHTLPETKYESISEALFYINFQVDVYSLCSAFMIGDGKLLTNAHCVEHGTQVLLGY